MAVLTPKLGMHKFIPSVIGTMKTKEETYSREAVIHSGPTYTAIRSAKNNRSSDLHHLQDMEMHLLH